MGKPHGKPGGKAARAAGSDDDDEMEQGSSSFFGAIALEKGPVSARKLSRLEAETEECIAKYGAAPLAYVPTDADKMEDARAAAKSKIAERVLAAALKQRDKKAQGMLTRVAVATSRRAKQEALSEPKPAEDPAARTSRAAAALAPVPARKHGKAQRAEHMSARKLERRAKYGEPKKRWSD